MSAKFLTEEQRKVAEGRVQAAGTGKGKSSWKTSQITECLLDPKTFFFVGISLLAQVRMSCPLYLSISTLQG